MPEEKRQKGRVKWYQARLGYGFITGEDGEDYFAHHTEIQMEGFRKLKKDQEGSFIPKSGNEGLMAMQIISAG